MSFRFVQPGYKFQPSHPRSATRSQPKQLPARCLPWDEELACPCHQFQVGAVITPLKGVKEKSTNQWNPLILGAIDRGTPPRLYPFLKRFGLETPPSCGKFFTLWHLVQVRPVEKEGREHRKFHQKYQASFGREQKSRNGKLVDKGPTILLVVCFNKLNPTAHFCPKRFVSGPCSASDETVTRDEKKDKEPEGQAHTRPTIRAVCLKKPNSTAEKRHIHGPARKKADCEGKPLFRCLIRCFSVNWFCSSTCLTDWIHCFALLHWLLFLFQLILERLTKFFHCTSSLWWAQASFFCSFKLTLWDFQPHGSHRGLMLPTLLA